MAKLKFKLGKPLASPRQFQPDQTVSDQIFVYRLDTGQLICHRTCKLPNGPAPGYFRLILPSTASKPPMAPRPTTARTIKHGIIIPTLIIGLITGLLLLLYPILPAVTYRVHLKLGDYSNDTSALAAPDPAHNQLIIPKIGVATAILEGPTLAILTKHEGVWHQTGNISDSNFVLAGHRWRYLPPNTSTFYNLEQLKLGDTVVVDWYGTRHLYSVSATQRVNQNDTDILKPTSTTEITLYTCYDKHQTERIVVVATPQP